MENKKLIKVVTKDIADLEELIAEMKTKHRFDLLEMEFLHTRIKGVLHLMQLLNESDVSVPEPGKEHAGADSLRDRAGDIRSSSAGVPTEAGTPKGEDKEEKEKPLPGIIPEPQEDDEESGEPQKEPLPGVVPEPPAKDEGSPLPRAEMQEGRKNGSAGDDDEMLQEDPATTEKGARLGDSFLKNRSVNDLIKEQIKLEYKLSNRPVASIQSYIGINDRFLYTRELFDGDSKKFVEAVKALDSMNNIKEAIDYLRAHYKWKKNETSLKFVNLVKRRFLNPTA